MVNRVLIVDDEVRILQSLYGLLSEAFRFEIYRASSAVEAQKLLMQMQFDLVITDISMPGMSGMELLKVIKRLWPRTYVILLTVYSSFEYAYEASRYDRVEYLLKIESYDIILRAVRRTMEAIEAEHAQDMRRLQDELELRAMRKGVAQYLIRRCVVQGKALPGDFDLSGIDLQPGRRSLLMRTVQASDAPLFSIAESLREAIESRGLRLFSLSMQAEQVFLIQREEGACEYDESVCVSAVQEDLERLIQGIPQGMAAALVQCFLPWSRLSSAYRSAGIAMNSLYGESGVVLLGEGDISEQDRDSMRSAFTIDEVNALYALSQSAPQARFLQAFEEKLSDIRAESPGNRSAAVFLLEQIAHSFGEECAENLDSLAEAGAEWPRAALRMARELLDARECSRQQAVSWLVQQVNRYVAEHLSEDLTLTALAKYIHYNPSYLSRIYKQQTGMNLMSYVSTMRIRRACELLAQTSMKVGQIAIECGICSTKYFNELFRKSLGVTPLEYRQTHIRRSGNGQDPGETAMSVTPLPRK